MLYKLQYIERLKAPEKWYFSFGTSMHACVEQFFKVKTPPCPSLDELYEIYDREWLSAGYESAEEEARYKAYGKDILKKFWEIHAPGFRIPIALERRFYLDIQGIKLMGFIDRVDKLESGGLSIVDYKTNQELFTNDYVDSNLQLTIYQMAAEQTWRLPVEKLTLYHLRTNTPCATLPRNKEQSARCKNWCSMWRVKSSVKSSPRRKINFAPVIFRNTALITAISTPSKPPKKKNSRCCPASPRRMPPTVTPPCR